MQRNHSSCALGTRRFPTGRAFLSVLALSGLSPVFAQSANPPPAEQESDEVVVLSPFTVSSERDRGYQATDTLAGTRIRTDLADIGSAISVVTKEFMDDLGAVNNETLLAYTTNTEVSGPRGNFSGAATGPTEANENAAFGNPNSANRIRGLTSADNTRNFFLSSVAWDSYNVSRVDLQRGPNAILFGLGSPAGVINGTTDAANFHRNRGEVGVRVDQFGSIRASLNYNHVLIPGELAVRAAILEDERKFRQDPAFQDDERHYIAASYRPKALNNRDTLFQISGNFENVNSRSNRPRTVTPMDYITPFFIPQSEGGQGGQTVNRLTYDTRALVGGQPNPNYNFNSWLTSDFGVGGPMYIYNSAGSQPYWRVGQLVTEGALNSAGVVQNPTATVTTPNTLIHGGAFNPLTLEAFPTHATEEGYPYAALGAYRQIGLSDPSIFDFYNKLLDGPNKGEWQDAKLAEISLENTFFRNRLGYSIAFFKEEAYRGQTNVIGSANRIKIDVNEIDIEGNPNPNVGRAYVDEPLFGGNSVEWVDREALRAQIFGAYDFSENKSGWLGRLVGRQSVNAVYQSDEDSRHRRTMMLRAPTPDFENYAALTGIVRTNWRFTPRYYLSGDLRGRALNSGLNLSNVADNIIPAGGVHTIRYFDTTWAPPAGVTPGQPWTPPMHVPVNNNPYLFQSQNPANYVGWRNGTFTMVDSLDGTQASMDYATRAAAKTQFDVESLVAVYQGYFLNNGLVLTYGWREDTYESRSVEAPFRLNGAGQSSADEGANVDPSVFSLNSPNAFRKRDKTNTTNWSAVAHVNRLLGERDPLPLNVSFSYNRGEAFAPVAGRLDGFGRELPTPAGKTEDIGVLLATKDNKYSLRVTKYETEIALANSPANIDSQMFILEQAISFPARTLAIINDLQGQARENLLNTYTAAPSDIPSTWTGTQPEYFREVIMPAYVDFLDQLDTKFTDFVNYWTRTGALVPRQGGPTNNVFTQRPATHRYTENQISRGYEFEFTANPTPNWRIAVNASKSEAIRSDVPDAAFSEIIDFIDNAYRNTPAGLMKVNISATSPNLAGTAVNATVRNNHWARFLGNVIYLRALNGQPQPEVREWRANVISNYSFSEGALRGVGVGGAYRYVSSGAIGFPYIQIPGEPDPTLDLNSPYKADAEHTFDLWLSYRRKLTDKIDWRIQLNVFNAFGKNEVVPLNTQVDGSPGMFRIREGRSWAITNTFSF